MNEASNSLRSNETFANKAKRWKRSIVLLGVAVLLVSAISIRLYSTEDKPKRELDALLQNYKEAAINARRAVFKVDQMREVHGLSNARAALEAVNSAKAARAEAKKVFDSLLSFIDAKREQLLSEGLGLYVEQSKIYGTTHNALQQGIDCYLDRYQAVLEYTIENDTALKSEDEAARRRYEKLNADFLEAYAGRWLAHEAHDRYLVTYAEAHPELVGFIRQARDMMFDIDIE